MRALWCGALILSVFATSPRSLRAADQAEAKAIVDKALKAMGGEAKVAGLQAGTWKSKLTRENTGRSMVIVIDATWQGTDQYRLDAEFQAEGRGEKVTVVINGDKGWAKKATGVKESPELELAITKNVLYAIRMPHLLGALKDKPYKLSLLGEVKINNKAALGLSITHKDFKEVSLFFDKETGLPVKAGIRVSGPDGDEFAIEYLYAEYKEMDGIQHPTKITVKTQDTDANLEISEVKAKERMDDSEFAKP